MISMCLPGVIHDVEQGHPPLLLLLCSCTLHSGPGASSSQVLGHLAFAATCQPQQLTFPDLASSCGALGLAGKKALPEAMAMYAFLPQGPQCPHSAQLGTRLEPAWHPSCFRTRSQLQFEVAHAHALRTRLEPARHASCCMASSRLQAEVD